MAEPVVVVLHPTANQHAAGRIDPPIVRLSLMLHEFIAVNREELIRLCRAKVATRSAPPPTPAEIDHGVPMFLDQLGHALRLGLDRATRVRLARA